ncbi:lipid asymmetry maintenance ABC transporter permease subunit MlaE [Hydromonas duriensis]|nr:lipid asymmetry maintenance ABC transporter permease subunit MlaE [Hydromonas duriensis]
MNLILNRLEKIGARVRGSVSTLGFAMRMLAGLFANAKVWFSRTRLVFQQIHFLGNYSLVIMIVSAAFIGAVLGLQAFYTLSRVGSESMVGLLVALSLVRELAPVVVAILFAGRAGTSMTAEIGLMKAGEQLSAMEMMGVDPINRVFAPRFWAAGFVVPMLTGLFALVGVYGGYVVAVWWLGVDDGAFWSMMNDGVSVREDIVNGLIKSVVFGLAVSFLAVYEGAQAHPTPEGVAQATTRTVVKSALLVLGLDFILTALMFS